jgi:hypothetical protein
VFLNIFSHRQNGTEARVIEYSQVLTERRVAVGVQHFGKAVEVERPKSDLLIFLVAMPGMISLRMIARPVSATAEAPVAKIRVFIQWNTCGVLVW